MTPQLLKRLANEIDAGRPLWTMLRVNQWLCCGDPVWQALATRARAALLPTHPAQLSEAILQGATYTALTADQQAALRFVETGMNSPGRDVVRGLPPARPRSSMNFTRRRMARSAAGWNRTVAGRSKMRARVAVRY